MCCYCSWRTASKPVWVHQMLFSARSGDMCVSIKKLLFQIGWVYKDVNTSTVVKPGFMLFSNAENVVFFLVSEKKSINSICYLFIYFSNKSVGLILFCLYFQIEELVNDVHFALWEWTAEYFEDPSMTVSFDPSRINPCAIKNSLADRHLVLSGENTVCIWIAGWQLKGHLKWKQFSAEVKVFAWHL